VTWVLVAVGVVLLLAVIGYLLGPPPGARRMNARDRNIVSEQQRQSLRPTSSW
jgi:hypothetical protein